MAIHVQQIEDRARSNTKRLDKLEQRQDNLDKLISAVAGMQTDLECYGRGRCAGGRADDADSEGKGA